MVTNWSPFRLVPISTGTRFDWCPFHAVYPSHLVVNHNNKKSFQSNANCLLGDILCFAVKKLKSSVEGAVQCGQS